jgi:hypothetical protein
MNADENGDKKKQISHRGAEYTEKKHIALLCELCVSVRNIFHVFRFPA